MAWARYIEDNREPKGGVFTVQRQFADGDKVTFPQKEPDKYRVQQIPRAARASGARIWEVVIPCIFAVLYFCLGVFSLKLFIDNVWPNL